MQITDQPPPRVSPRMTGRCPTCGHTFENCTCGSGNAPATARLHHSRTSALSWLSGGNDHQLAATRYAGRQSATHRANGRTAQHTARTLLRQQGSRP